MSLDALLARDFVSIESQVASKDAAGGVVRTYGTTASGVHARVEEASSSQRQQFAQQLLTVTHVVWTRQPGIKNGDRIITSSGRVLLVNGVQKYTKLGVIPTHYQITCEEIRQGA